MTIVIQKHKTEMERYYNLLYYIVVIQRRHRYVRPRTSHEVYLESHMIFGFAKSNSIHTFNLRFEKLTRDNLYFLGLPAADVLFFLK